MKKTLFGLFCLSLLLHAPLTPLKAQEVQSSQSYPQSERTLSEKELNKIEAYKGMGKHVKDRIDKKSPAFGKVFLPYPDRDKSKDPDKKTYFTMLVDNDHFQTFIKGTTNRGAFNSKNTVYTYPKVATADIIINQPAPQTPAIYKKTGKPYFGISDGEMAALSGEEQDYIKALLMPLNENFHAIYTAPVKKILPSEAREGALAGHVALLPEIRPVTGTPFGETLTPLQRELYDTLGGRFVYKFFETPEKVSFRYSVCGVTNRAKIGSRWIVVVTESGDLDSFSMKYINTMLVSGNQMGVIHILRRMKEGMQTVLANKEIDPAAPKDLTPFKKALLKVALQVDTTAENTFKQKVYTHEEGGVYGFHLTGKNPRPEKPMFTYVPEIYNAREIDAQLKKLSTGLDKKSLNSKPRTPSNLAFRQHN